MKTTADKLVAVVAAALSIGLLIFQIVIAVGLIATPVGEVFR